MQVDTPHQRKYTNVFVIEKREDTYLAMPQSLVKEASERQERGKKK